MRSHDLNRRDFLRLAGAGAALAALPRLASGAETPPAKAGKRPPNLIFILADDLGFELLTCYGGDTYKGLTPNLDALAAGGMRFTRCHTMPVCAPSRCQFLTGQYPFRTGAVENGFEKDVRPDRFPSIAKALREAGYATAMVGKWHGLRPDPSGWGFDEYLRSPAAAGVYWINPPGGAYTVNGQKIVPETRVSFSDAMHEFTAGFIAQCKDRPFFLYYPMHFPHVGGGFTSPDSPPGVKSDLNGVLSYGDKMVGRLVAELDRLKLRENTLVIFASDNGNCGFKGTIGGRKVVGGKRGLKEGGCTVPFIANWPGTIPAGKVNDELVDFADMLPTFVELAGGTLPADKPLDGVSIVPQLRGEKGSPKGWAFAQIRDRWFVRDDRWKLTHTGELYDLSDGLFVETLVPAEAEPETRQRLDAIAERLGVRQAVRAHPEWVGPSSAKEKGKPWTP
jgi:arylsulfatase A-like enzyme